MKLNQTREVLMDGTKKTPESKGATNKENITGDVFGGTAAMLVALPSAIAFGLIIYAPLGQEFAGRAALSGILGTIALAIVASLFGGTNRLVSAPCAPAAAVLSVFVLEASKSGHIPLEMIPVYITFIALFTGGVQLLIGKLGLGKFIKYIPYPVVAGYLSGVGVLIFIGQLPKYLGITQKVNFWGALSGFGLWNWESIVVGSVTILVMVFAPKLTKKIPAAIIALASGIASYFALAAFNPALGTLDKNPYVIGSINAKAEDILNLFYAQWSMMPHLDFAALGLAIFPALTLSVLLSIDTLKTCVVLDALTYSRHNSNKELIGQGLGNVASGLVSGIPGAGTMGATLVNMNSGAKTSFSGLFVGITALLVLLLFGSFVAWIPFSALAGILLVVAVRMVDKKSFTLMKNKTTRFDFVCILGVVISAVALNLIAAAGVGIAIAILLFLREQIRSSVVRRKVFGNKTFSKKIRTQAQIEVLQAKGDTTILLELQGQLFFGTTDQLFSEIEPYLAKCHFVIMDMKRVQSVDFTAVNMLKQIQARIKTRNGHLIFTSLPLSLPTGQNVKSYLEDLGLWETESLKFFDSIDTALGWAEDEIISEEMKEEVKADQALEVEDFEFFKGLSQDAIQSLKECLTESNFKSGESIFVAGEESDEIYFIRKGMVKIVLPIAGGGHYHIASFTRGIFFGDMSFLDKGTRSANAVADGAAELYILSRAKFDEAADKNPEMGTLFFERMARMISGRLRQSNIEIQALQES